MKYVSLAEFCKDFGQRAEAARLLGVTPSAIKKMLDRQRQITLAFDDADSFIDYIEFKTGSALGLSGDEATAA